MKLNLDCRLFRGEKPCIHDRLCEGCRHYQPTGKKILIIKLGARGDVLRTTPLLKGLKRKYRKSHITWLVDKNGVELLDANPLIDRTLGYDTGNVLRLGSERFDLLICLDKEIRATALVPFVNAVEKSGFGFSPEGNIHPLNREAEYAFKLGISNRLKFRENKKTYQEMIFDVAGLPYKRDEYIFSISKGHIDEAQRSFEVWGVRKGDTVVGLNTGSGDMFATKRWAEDSTAKLAEKLSASAGVKVFLLGGPCEIERNRRILARCGAPVIDTGCNNPLGLFAAYVRRCDALVSTDTLAMHLGIALGSHVVALLGATCHQEIDLYGRGEMLVSGVRCSPCYLSRCARMDCMKRIAVDTVYGAVCRGLKGAAGVGAGFKPAPTTR